MPESKITVTVFHSPSAWLASPQDLTEVTVTCLISKAHGNVIRGEMQVDLATPQYRFPEAFQTDGWQILRQQFRAALHAAVEDHLSTKVAQIVYDRIDWEGGE